MNIISRQEAKAQGLKTYFTGILCKDGHIDLRGVSDAACRECRRILWRKNYADNIIERRKQNVQWCRDNPELRIEYKKQFYERHAERLKAENTVYRLQHPEVFRAKQAKRRAAKLNATPLWVNMDDIKQIYFNCPPELEVDHIVPLQGKTVCGLHVPWNLQYLSKEENLRKRNRL